MNINTSSYAQFGTITVGPPEPQEPNHAALRKADRAPYGAVLKKMVWTDSDFNTARAYGFPAATGYVLSGVVNVRREPVYSWQQIAQWARGVQGVRGQSEVRIRTATLESPTWRDESGCPDD